MPPVSRSEFASQLGQLDGEEFARFVAALWEARGYETRIDGQRVRASRPDARDIVLWVRAAGGWLPGRREQPPASVDAVVTNRRRASESVGEQARVITADDLREMTLYAIDRSVGDQLCRRFLDCSITQPASDRESWTDRFLAELSGKQAFGLAGGLAIVVIAAGILVAPIAWEQQSPAEVTPASAVNRTPVAFQTATATPASTPEPEVRRTPVAVDPGVLPPGISRRGIADADAIARAHEYGVAQRSYELTITYREFNESMRGKRERIVVENATTYASEIITAGPLSTTPYVIADREIYADGKREFSRIPSETGDGYDVRSGDSEPNAAQFAERVEQYLRWFLSVEDSHIRKIESRDGKTFYQVITRGDPWPGVENATGIAVIESHGVVHFLRRVYTLPGSNGTSVTITIEYTEFGNASVEAPSWYREAETITNGTATRAVTQAPISPSPPRD